jgi:type II secretory pathway pseudopilin PulG
MRREEGMTIVEVMVAGLILVIGSLGLLGLVDTASRSTYRAEQSQVVSDRLQQEMEQIKQLPYEEIALTATPGDTSDTKFPNWRVTGTNFATGQDGSQVKPLVYNGGTLYEGGTISDGAVSAAPEAFDSGDVSGTIYRFITWEDDPSCPAAQCPGSQDLKRVVVALLLDTTASGGQRAYQELQAQIADPEAEPVDNENPVEGQEDATPWTFWFTDTPCNNATRQAIVADHLTHNTRGVCGTGMTNSNTPGAPDLIYTEAPPFDPEAPIFDYATDVEPTQNPDTDRGLQLVRQTSAGCPSAGLDIMAAPDTPETDRFQKIHKWLSPPVPGGYNVTLNGEGTLSLWSQTVNEAVHPGKLCIWLFVRRVNAQSQLVDTPAVNQAAPLVGQSYFTVTKTQWPTTWTEIQIPLDFTISNTLSPGTQLGVAIAVEQAGTGGGGLQFMYDEPSFDSRLEVKSTSLLPSF